MADLAGKMILHYKILEQIGRGGMGVVYLAEDTKLDREDAIKFLPGHIDRNSDENKRFKIEAKAAAALNHPNIATIYAIEESEDDTFIVMEYIKGRELKELIRLSEPTDPSQLIPITGIIDYATQIAAGLRAAHKASIIHRDIKSSNIMLTEDGQIKIMDFGLAKFGKMEERKWTELTKAGSTLGTGAYMSPEQARGEEVDYRTDIWSFGVVLYELCTGQLPFRGDYEQALLYSVINDDYEPISKFRNDIPEELQFIIYTSLQKKPEDRFRNFDEVYIQMKKLSGTSVITAEGDVIQDRKQKKALTYGFIAAAAIIVLSAIVFFFPSQENDVFSHSIAVLPFENMNQDAESEYFSNGITEDIITQLSKIGNLHVISRTSSMRYKNSEKSLRKIGEELNVAYILEGSIRRSEQRIRIVSQLIDSKSDEHVWAETYDREMADIFDIQSEISQKIARALQVQISTSEQKLIRRLPTRDLTAYDYYLKGREYYYTYRQADNENAIVLFKRALSLDPDYALALAGLGDAYAQRFWRFNFDVSWLDSSIAKSKHAIHIDPNLAEGYKALGLAYEYKGLYRQAIEENNKAIELNPNMYTAIANNGWCSYFIGESATALRWMEKSRQLDPTSATVYSGFGYIYWSMHDYEQAEKWYKKSLELQPDYLFSLLGLSDVLMAQGKYEQAKNYAEQILDLDPDGFFGQVGIANFYFYTGEYNLAKKYYQSAYKLIPRPNVAVAIGLTLIRQDSVEQVDRLFNSALKSIENNIKNGNQYFMIPLIAARIYSARSDKNETCAWLDKALNSGLRFYGWIERDPVFADMRDNPCFKSIIDRMKKLADEQRMLAKSTQ